MTQMYGYALATIDNVADHTWVYTADGFCCACPDNDARGCSDDDRRNGHIICQGDGNVGNGRCMAGSEDKFLLLPIQCGVVYAINGVCHQMANRILLATGNRDVNVKNAAGAVLSYFNYGTWGTSVPLAAWEVSAIVAAIVSVKVVSDFRERCSRCNISCPVLYDSEALARIPITTEVGLTLSERQQMVLAQERYLHTVQQIDEVCAQLAGRAPEDRLARVKQIFVDYHRPDRDRILGRAVDDAGAPPSREELARRIDAANAMMLQPLMEAANVLSESEFQSIFGHARDQRVQVIEPDILLKAAAGRAERRPEASAPPTP